MVAKKTGPVLGDQSLSFSLPVPAKSTSGLESMESD